MLTLHWLPPAGEAAAALVSGSCYMACSLKDINGRALYIGLNLGEDSVQAFLPQLLPSMMWRRVADTALVEPDDIDLENGQVLSSGPGGVEYYVAGKAVVVCEAVALAQPGGV